MKAGFYAYMILTAIDYSLTKRAIISRSRYLFSHLFGASLLPMVMMVYFFAGPAIFIKIESIPLEILFANLALIATSTNVFFTRKCTRKIRAFNRPKMDDDQLVYTERNSIHHFQLPPAVV
jgi:hypothetical protein